MNKQLTSSHQNFATRERRSISPKLPLREDPTTNSSVITQKASEPMIKIKKIGTPKN